MQHQVTPKSEDGAISPSRAGLRTLNFTEHVLSAKTQISTRIHRAAGGLSPHLGGGGSDRDPLRPTAVSRVSITPMPLLPWKLKARDPKGGPGRGRCPCPAPQSVDSWADQYGPAVGGTHTKDAGQRTRRAPLEAGSGRPGCHSEETKVQARLRGWEGPGKVPGAVRVGHPSPRPPARFRPPDTGLCLGRRRLHLERPFLTALTTTSNMEP